MTLRSTKTEDIDTNLTDKYTDVYEMGNDYHGIMFVHDKTGTHNNHRIQVQVSADGNDPWTNTSATIKGIGHVEFDTSAHYVRGRTIATEGERSTVNVVFQSK